MKEVRVTVTKLNNKSRRGEYAYVRAEGIKGKYYRMEELSDVQAVKQYFVDKYIRKKALGSAREYKEAYKHREDVKGKKTKRTGARRQAEQYIARIKKTRPSLSEAIKRGISSSTIKDATRAGNTEIRKAKKELLSELVLDDTLIELLIKDENFKKLKHRLEYRIAFKDEKGVELTTQSGIFNETIEKVLEEMRKIVKDEEDVVKERSPELSRKLKLYGYKPIEVLEEGSIKRVEIIVIFRKGK